MIVMRIFVRGGRMHGYPRGILAGVNRLPTLVASLIGEPRTGDNKKKRG